MNVTLLTRESSISIKDMENFAVNAALTCHGNTDKQVVNETSNSGMRAFSSTST